MPNYETSGDKLTASEAKDQFITNLVPSVGTESDWTYEDSLDSGALEESAALPQSVDLRADWWKINDQERTGSCVGWATADGVARWHFFTVGKIGADQLLSPRHVWMASKEFDEFVDRPSTFIEGAGTMLKPAVEVLRKYGAALESDQPFHINTTMYIGNENVYYARAAERKVARYFNLGLDLDKWKQWLAAGGGPILAGFQVDDSWYEATEKDGLVDVFQPDTVVGGHAIAIVGYRADGRFIVRNSWGTGWGDAGFGYLAPEYIEEAFFGESYGVTL